MKLKNLLKEEKLLVELIQKVFNNVEFNIRFYPKDGIINFAPANSKDLNEDNIDRIKSDISSYLNKKFRMKINLAKGSAYGINFRLYDSDIEKLIMGYLK